MEQTNYLKIVWILAFVAFASVSCWATAESLHLLLSTWPAIVCWIVSIGFFVIASVGTKMIVDSLNTDIYYEKRGTRLCMGVIIVLVFWLVCSMPTNTHTFMYRNVINSRVTYDINNTQNYLGQIKNNTNNKTQAKLKVDELNNAVEIKLGELEAEIMSGVNPGFGPKSKEILQSFATLLNVATIEPINYQANTKDQRERLAREYRKKIYTLRDSRARQIVNSILAPNPDIVKEVDRVNKNLDILKACIADGTVDLNDAEDMTSANGVCDQINTGYSAVKNNKQFVNFSSPEDEEAYTANNPVTKVSRLLSVFNAWEDYLRGEFEGHGFTFWIIISILVDVAAFLFFDLAFRKTTD